MNFDILRKMMKNGSIIIIVCVSFSLFFGVIAQAYSPASPTSSLISNPPPYKIDSGSFVIGFGYEGIYNTILPDSQSNTVDISARVYVRSYHRKDGTYVQSHYRRDPR